MHVILTMPAWLKDVLSNRANTAQHSATMARSLTAIDNHEITKAILLTNRRFVCFLQRILRHRGCRFRIEPVCVCFGKISEIFRQTLPGCSVVLLTSLTVPLIAGRFSMIVRSVSDLSECFRTVCFSRKYGRRREMDKLDRRAKSKHRNGLTRRLTIQTLEQRQMLDASFSDVLAFNSGLTQSEPN